uniref:Uncharacterized protein n=1 Tax=Stomoxys calcitrans TaxID=35570 RepID=A0A1I8PBT3_STOCA
MVKEIQKLLIALALVAAAAAQLSNDYLPPLPGDSYDIAGSAPTQSYLPPVAAHETAAASAPAPAHTYSDADGYRYKTQRRRVYRTYRRHRRDVSQEYLPPLASNHIEVASTPTDAYLPPVESYKVEASAPAHSYSQDDGYRYRTQRRRVFKTYRRHRRAIASE